MIILNYTSMNKQLYTILSLLIILNIKGRAQDKPYLYGKVSIVSTNMALEGATIRMLKSKSTTQTDVDGNFSLAFVQLPDTLICTYLGYETQKLFVNQLNETLEIVMVPDDGALQEVVVSTGYQTLPKERATGSFELLDNRKMNQIVSPDIMSRLEGTSTLQFDKATNRPSITLRGPGTINGDMAPLVVIDNFPYEGDINNINPNDIESISILKDAAAASIWGTRAGNGVIVINTKKGSFNQPLHVEFNANALVQEKPDLFYRQQIETTDLIDLERYLFGKGYYNNQEIANTRPFLSPVVELLIAQRDGVTTTEEVNRQINYFRTIDNRDQYRDAVYQRGINQQYALNFRGGSNKMSYVFSGGYDKNVNDLSAKYNRLSARAANDFKISEALTINTSFIYTNSDNKSGRTAYGDVTALRPYQNLYDENGNALAVARYRRTYTDTLGGGRLLDWNLYPAEDYRHNVTESNLQNLLATLSVNYRFNKLFSASLRYQYENQQQNTNSLRGQEGYFTRDLINRFTAITANGQTVQRVPLGDILDKSNARMHTQNLRAQLNFDHRWQKHYVNAILGGEIRSIGNSSNAFRLYGYDPEVLTFANVDYANPYPTIISARNEYIPQNVSLGETKNNFVSQYVNAAYTYDARYTLSLSARRDASNLFGVNTNEKWQPLWSSGLSWNIADESFYDYDALPFLKLRTTYGVSGMVDQSRSAVTTMTYFASAMYTNYRYASLSQFPNPELRWEKSAMLNIALDFAFRNNRVSGSIEHYWKRGTDLFGLAPVDITAGLGSSSVMRNVANMKGRGFDIILNANWLTEGIVWNSNLLFSTNNNHITEYFNTSTRSSAYVTSGTTIAPLVGNPVYAIVSYPWLGLNAEGNPVSSVDGVASTDYNAVMAADFNNLRYSGSATPRVFGALNNAVSYKKFQFSFNIAYKFGHYFRKPTINYGDLFTMSAIGQGTADYAQRWQQAGDELWTSVPALTYPNNTNRNTIYRLSEANVARADHIRLQYINLSYNFKLNGKKSVDMQVYANAQNLGIIWRANKVGLDPDFVGNVLPTPRSIALGMRTNF
jgi:TonB-linked SusC/RagA family outer membrane protein